MGYAMAANIRKKLPGGVTLQIFDVYAPSCERFRSEFSSFGTIKIVSSAREAAENAKVLISIVPTGANVEAVYLDRENGVIAASRDPERLFVECSTIESHIAVDVSARLSTAGTGRYVDAPVSVC